MVFGVELVDELGCGIATRRSKPRTQALLLIGMMIRCRSVEVLQDVARGASCLGVGTMDWQMATQPFQRVELAAHAVVARVEHRQRVIEPGGVVGKQVGHGGRLAQRNGASTF